MFDEFDENESFSDEFKNNSDIESSLTKFKRLETDDSVFFSEDEIESLSYHFFLNNRYKEQLAILNHGLYLYPNKIDFMIEKAQVLSMDNLHNEALNLIRYAKDFEPYNALIHKMEGEILFDLDKPEEAEDCFRIALRHCENEEEELVIEIYINYAQALSQNNRVEKANSLMEKAISRYHDNELLFNQLSMNFIANGQYDQAITYYKNHIDSNPYSHQGWYQLGRFYELTGKKELAFSSYEYSGLANKNSKSAFFSMGGILENRSEYESAIENYLQSIKNSGDLYPYVCIARCYLSLEKSELSRRYLKKAEGLEDMLPEYHCLMGYSYLNEGQAVKALPFFKRVLKNDKNDFASFKGLLNCYAELDRIEEIEAAYIKMKDDSPEVITENWKELSALLYHHEVDTLFDDLIEDIDKSGKFAEELLMVMKIIQYDLHKTKRNKDKVIKGLIHNFDDTFESIKLFCPELAEEDSEFKQVVELCKSQQQDEQ